MQDYAYPLLCIRYLVHIRLCIWIFSRLAVGFDFSKEECDGNQEANGLHAICVQAVIIPLLLHSKPETRVCFEDRWKCKVKCEKYKDSEHKGPVKHMLFYFRRIGWFTNKKIVDQPAHVVAELTKVGASLDITNCVAERLKEK